ncbi:hypothetical protein [Evansella halocellulosilytica]|uniref:hypothetical protein n=1 Tax=Evansella halocellulosilytica TaxID=2011013 RepID=UPI000BB73D95|nr:hypothetical protein [Evansella halocellulosilytica]
MESEELKLFKRELKKEIAILRKEQKSFKRRVSTIANLLIPGVGFVVYGSSYLTGLISFVLFIAYNYFYFNKLTPSIGELAVAIIYYIPALIICIVSTIMVLSLED